MSVLDKERSGSCDICHGYCEDFEIKTEIGGDGWLAGAEGCPTLNKYLRGYFITTKLLKQQILQVAPNFLQPEQDKLVKRKIGRPKIKRRIVLEKDFGNNGGFSSGGNVKLLYSTICGCCDKIVNEAVHVHQQKMELQRRLDRLAETLQEIQILADKVKREAKEDVESEKQRIHDEDTQKQMLGQSMTCLGKVPLPPRRTSKRNSPKKLCTQAPKSYSEEKRLELEPEPEPQSEAEDSPHDTFFNLEVDNNGQRDGYPICPNINEADTTGGGALMTPNDQEEEELEYEPSEEDLSNYSDDDSDFEPSPSPTKKSRTSTSNKKIKETSSSDDDDNSCNSEDDNDNFEIFGNQDDKKSTKLPPLSKTKCPKLLNSRRGRRRLYSKGPQNEEEKKWAKIPCGECGKVCFSGELLDDHLRKMHETKIPQEDRKKSRNICHFCTKRFYLEQRYFIHVQMVHPEKNEEGFCCDQCDIGFSTTTQLKQHLKQSHDAEVEGKSIHICDQCEWPFLDESSLKTHSLVHNQVKTKKKPVKTLPRDELFATLPFKCWFCWESFPQRDKLERHLKNNRRHKTLKVEFPCDVESCEYYSKPFVNFEELNEHLKSCHGDSSDILECQWCSWGFTSKNMLSLHQLNHMSPDNTYHYKCPLCDRICKKKVTLINHYNVAHELNLKPNKCPHCPERFVTLIAVQLHIKEEHSDLRDMAKMLTCDKCGKLCSNAKSLDSHVRCNHRDHTCSTCSKVFQTYDQMRKHVKTDHNIGPRHLCSLCGAGYSSSYSLRIHMDEVHKKPKFECQICHGKLKNKANLKYHMKSIHNPTKLQGPPAPFVCKECGKGYSKKDTLDDHVRVKHSQDNWRVWTCDQCGKRFKRAKDLTIHLAGKACPKRLDAPVIIA